MNDLISSFVEIEPVGNDEFLKIRETLTRIGIPSRHSTEDKPILWQSCHILHKRGHYYIVHFKELFLLDGRDSKTKFTEEDRDRRNYIAFLLSTWGLVTLCAPVKTSNEEVKMVIIPYAKKSEWDLRTKYNIGRSE